MRASGSSCQTVFLPDSCPDRSCRFGARIATGLDPFRPARRLFPLPSPPGSVSALLASVEQTVAVWTPTSMVGIPHKESSSLLLDPDLTDRSHTFLGLQLSRFFL